MDFLGPKADAEGRCGNESLQETKNVKDARNVGGRRGSERSAGSIVNRFQILLLFSNPKSDIFET
jgi:hypothetical protein